VFPLIASMIMVCWNAMGRCHLVLFLLQCFLTLPIGVCSSSKKGHSSSNLLLKMHQLYTKQPPHDTALYDLLEVSPNATSTEIARSYRKITRRLHPDKQRRGKKKENINDQEVSDDEDADESDHRRRYRLARVRAAYEILKHDSRRLPYHRHGLLNPMDAVYILTGSVLRQHGPPQYASAAASANSIDEEDVQRGLQMELLELMGYYYNNHQKKKSPFDRSSFLRPESDARSHRDRVHFIAASLLERLIPVVEGTLPEHVFLDHLIQQCDRYKSLPLGAQIVRCIGRAYRYSGERMLRRGLPLATVQENVRGVMRQAKYFANAAVAGGRVVLEERKVKQKQQQTMDDNNNNNNNNGNSQRPVHWEDMEETELALSGGENSSRDQEFDKAHQAVLESLQVEALWKICKIDLDRTIRTACNVLLDGPTTATTTTTLSGWVGANGNTIVAHNGRIQLALLLVRMGNIMVHRSKEGTAWME
jgi:DnaJ domain/X-domain of DnaJ-containing